MNRDDIVEFRIRQGQPWRVGIISSNDNTRTVTVNYEGQLYWVGRKNVRPFEQE